MLFTLLLSLFLLGFALLVFSARNKYWNIRADCGGRVKNKIIKIPLQNIYDMKLQNEVRFFNSLCLVAECKSGVAAEYINQINCLLKSPKHRPTNDPYTKLFYAYACFVLLHKVGAAAVRRQLNNNLRWVFAPDVKIVKKIKPVLCGKKYSAYPPVPYKIFDNSFVAMSGQNFETEKSTAATVCDSFVLYKNAEIEIKQFDGFYDIYAKNEQRISFAVSGDKGDWDCGISRGVVRCCNLISGEIKKYKITGDNVRISSSILDKTDKLEIYVTATGAASVSVNGAKRRLLSPREVKFNKRAERIVRTAHNARFVAGENLRQRYLLTEKEIPSLRLLTAVYEISGAETILGVLDDLECYKKAAKLFNGFNIVFLYSGSNDFAAKLVAGFIGREDINELYKNNVFMYFIDRVVAPVDAIYYLTRAIKAGNSMRSAVCGEITTDNSQITVREIKNKSYPYTKLVILQNTSSKQQTVTAIVPILFGGLSAVACDGKTVTAVGLYSGRTNIYKLPKEATVNIKAEMLTDRIEIVIKTKLANYEQKKFQIVKNECALSPKERKSRFLKSVGDICVQSADPKFNKIFSLTVAERETPQVLHAAKSAVKNVDRALFISILSARNELGSDLWAWLLNKIVGVRLIKNTIQIVPNINITGDFSLSFVYDGKPYNFNVVQNSGGCSINYENGKQNNFLQINF
jgi:hypothetical protein